MSGSRSSSCRAAAPAALAACLAVLAGPLAAESLAFRGDSTVISTAEGGQHAVLTGHAQVESKDLRITADTIELFGKDFIYVQCRGTVHIVDTARGLDLTSQDVFYDREKKIARIRGNAVMADVKNDMVAKAGFIEDRNNEKLTIMQIGVRIFSKDIVCRAEFARYWRETKILELSGMPWVSKGGDVYQAARITINLDTEDITFEVGVQGTIQDRQTDTGGGATAAPAPAPDTMGTGNGG
jgi:lipopolysaccharide export system protein LptA